MVAQLGKDLGQAKLIDTHAHINVEHFAEDRDAVVERAAQAGLSHIVNMGDSMESSQSSVALTKIYPMVYTGVGIHPEEAHPMTQADEDQLASWGVLPKVVAIGEIGLDYYWEKDGDKRQLQRELFIRQLDLARQLHLPVCVHNREAHGDTMEILRKEGKGIVGVMHCFSGSLEIAQELVKMGWFIGVDGPLTFKNAAKLPEIVQKLPLERIVVETDCPYMAPVPMRGKRNEPAFVYHVAAKLAQLRGESLEKVARQTTANALELYPKLEL
ncbi:TatD family hydrolase [Anaerovibrio lipolyticus]|nr:TatD family hydrolase [Anaerovibrio lipolyticus]MCF2601475.1 TatD family hydrolase [Anaerovibrio lipolyticus]